MLFPSAAAEALAEPPVGAFDGPAGAAVAAVAGAVGDDPAAGGGASEAPDVPPRLLT